MTPPASQQPKEHCGHECICWFAHGGMRPGECVSGPCCIPCKHDTRSRPHPTPQQPSSKLLKAISGDCQGEIDCVLRGDAKDLAKRILYYIQCDEQQHPAPQAQDQEWWKKTGIVPDEKTLQQIPWIVEHDAAIERKAREGESVRWATALNTLIATESKRKDRESVDMVYSYRIAQVIESLRQQQGGQEQGGGSG